MISTTDLLELVQLEYGGFQGLRLLADVIEECVQLQKQSGATYHEVGGAGYSGAEMHLQFLHRHVDLGLLDGDVAHHLLA